MKYIDAEKLKERVTRLIASARQNDWPIAEDYLRRVIDIINSLQQEQPEVFDTMAFQKGVAEGRRLEREDVKSIIQSRIDEILGDAQPAPILRMELQELIKKIES